MVMQTGHTSAGEVYLGTQQYDPLLKDVILPMIDSMIVEQFSGYKYFKSKSDDPWEGSGTGRRLVGQVETEINGSFVALPQGASIPDAGKSAYQNWELWQKFSYAVMALSGQVLTQSKGNAIADAFTTETKGVVRKCVLELQRMLWGNSTGILCKQVGALAANIVTIVSTYGSHFPTDTRHLLKGSRIMWGTEPQLAASTLDLAQAGYGYISQINSSTTFTIVKTAGVDSAEGDYFVMGQGTAPALYPRVGAIYEGNELMGLRGFGNISGEAASSHNPSYLQGITGGTTTPDWNGQYLNLVDGVNPTWTLTEDDLLRATDMSYNNAGVVPLSWLFTPAINREIGKALLADRRFVNKETYVGGLKKDGLGFATTYGDATLVLDRLAFPHEIVMVDPEFFWYSWSQNPGWWDLDGRILRMGASRKDEVEALYRMYGNMGTRDRRRIFRLRDIQSASS